MGDAGRIVVLRCRACGDTFPIEENAADLKCPTCGGTALEVAGEPLL